MPVKVKVNQAALTANVKQTFYRVISDKNLQDEIGNKSADRMKAFARIGKSIVTGKTFKKYSESYQLMRIGAAKFRTIKTEAGNRVVIFPGPDEILKHVDPQFFTAPRNKANLTLTGQMIKSIQILDRKNGVIKVGPTGKRKTFGRKANKINSSNAELAKIHQSGAVLPRGKIPARPFIGMDAKGLKVLKNIVIRNLRRMLAQRRQALLKARRAREVRQIIGR